MKHTNKGFTLVELLVVVAIIGLLAGIAVVSVNSVRVKARDARRLADAKQLQNALELYNNTKGGVYPMALNVDNITPTNADVNLGTAGYTVISETNQLSGVGAGEIYINIIPKDPTSTQNYIYRNNPNGTTYGIEFHTEGDNKDHCANPTGISDTVCPQ